jgi:hypothetical protein
VYISSPSMQPQEGKKWTTFTPPAAGSSRRYRGRLLHRRSHSVAPDRITLRTVFRETRSSRQICLIDFLS